MLGQRPYYVSAILSGMFRGVLHIVGFFLLSSSGEVGHKGHVTSHLQTFSDVFRQWRLWWLFAHFSKFLVQRSTLAGLQVLYRLGQVP